MSREKEVGSSARFIAGATASLASLITAKYLEYYGYYAPYPSIMALLTMIIVPGLVGGSFLLSAAAAATGGAVGALVWLIVIPRGSDIFGVFNSVGLDPLVGYLLLLPVASAFAGAVGLAAGPKRGGTPEAGVVEEGVAEPRGVTGVQTALEAKPRVESRVVPEPRPKEAVEEIYLICKFCSEPYPQGARYCPHCGRRQA